ncbi:alpha/beta hydrolase-like protein [Elsinoe ampelina]|uniref:Alpha/beta hydrolase-like protein n=1 Tax=Elsinoe ampelina TaxID=302913 RepID=A0A6A6FY79_9PEZI|nr:alpha/beta hydrolase-like protein [Elsinoe ampelina]
MKVSIFSSIAVVLATISQLPVAIAQTANSSYANGLDFVYPFPVHFYNFISQTQNLSVAYMDVSPDCAAEEQKGTIVLMHGKNFCTATWNDTIRVLLSNNYRVVAIDQIGFCKSTKPSSYQFTLHQLASNTNSLLLSLNITSATIMGHSMGGMLAARYSLMFPLQTTRLIMVDPLGLEDWFSLGVPYQPIDKSYRTELNASYTSIRSYQQSTYYNGNWLPQYDVPVNMLLSIYKGPEGPKFAFNMAATTDMVFTQPWVYEAGNIVPRTLLVVGDKDTTAIGKTWAPDSVKPDLGHYDVLGPRVCARIPACTLVAFAELGHAPQVEDPEAFHGALLGWLG